MAGGPSIRLSTGSVSRSQDEGEGAVVALRPVCCSARCGRLCRGYMWSLLWSLLHPSLPPDVQNLSVVGAGVDGDGDGQVLSVGTHCTKKI